jgi:diguanylate cyclase (GGDEF)-like protein
VGLLGVSLTAVTLSSALPGSGLANLAPSVVTALVVSLTVVLRFYRAVREQEAAQAVVQHQAHHDQLTGAANRALVRQRLAEAVDTEQAALVFLDLDGFKAVNDVHGHPAGDAVLRAVSDRLRAAVRAGDTVGRLGGDEFVLVCHGVAADAVQELGQRLAAVVRQPIDLGGTSARVGASVGVLALGRRGGAGWPAGRPAAVDWVGRVPEGAEQVADEMLRAVDEAMYAAKRGGGGVVAAARIPAQPLASAAAAGTVTAGA